MSIRIETIWRLQPVITLNQITNIRDHHTGSGVISVSYRSTSRYWNFLRWFSTMPALLIQRRQFRNQESWDRFLSLIAAWDYRVEAIHPATAYPPTFPEVPCPSCGLTIPTYEAVCPNCAAPRSPEKDP